MPERTIRRARASPLALVAAALLPPARSSTSASTFSAALSAPASTCLAALLFLLTPGAAASAAPAAPAPAPLLSPSCSACVAVASALDARLAAEAPNNDLDWRGRVGPDGARTGVRVSYALSEARLDALLGDLCTAGLGDAAWWGPPGGEEGVWGQKDQAPPREGWARPSSRPEKESRAKALENACGRLVSDWEDDLAEALLKEEGGSGEDVGALLCERLSKACRVGQGRVRKEGGGGSAAQKEEL